MKVERCELFAEQDSQFRAAYVLYDLEGDDRITIAVHTSVEEAKRVFRYWTFVPQVLRAESLGSDVGDEVLGRGSQSILFRRDNVLVHLQKAEGSPREALDLAQRIDQLIQSDREIAPRGRFAETPEIVDAGFPQTLTVRRMVPVTPDGEPALWPGQRADKACVRIRPQFRGLGPVEKLYLHVVIEGLGRNQGWAPVAKRDPAGWLSVPDESGRYIRRVHPSAENDGRFILEIRVPDQAETRKARLIAATEDNLIVTKEVEVTIVPAD